MCQKKNHRNLLKQSLRGNNVYSFLSKSVIVININIIDAEKILEAHKDPYKYPDLVVRVTGFTAYFAMLSPEFRQLVVDRITSVNPRQLNQERES